MDTTPAAVHAAPPHGWTYRFDDIEARPQARALTRGGQHVGIEPKAHAVLGVLLEHAGEAIAREALLDRVWGHRHVTPAVLNRIIAQLRRALGDEAGHPHYIQAVHGMGYRFIGDVARSSIEDEAEIGKRTAEEEAVEDGAAGALEEAEIARSDVLSPR